MKKILPIILITLMITMFTACENEKNDISGAIVEAAERKVKSLVYKNYGEVPKVSGELIYTNEEEHIVAVKFELGESYSGSHACHVYARDESSVCIYAMTEETYADYDYRSHLEELKALWAIK